MINEAFSASCGLLVVKFLSAMWLSLTQQPPSVLPALLTDLLVPSYFFMVECFFLISSDLSLHFSLLSNYLLLTIWTGKISIIA